MTRILDSGVDKTVLYKKALTGTTATANTEMFKTSSVVVSKGIMEYVKDRIVMAINNSIYEISTSATSLPTALYTHSDTDIIFTSITASGPAIYISGFDGIQSFIYKFTLNTSGVMPTLTTAITAAEMPVGEIIHKIYYYLGYMMIGTNKGIRAAVVSDQDGSINYGPLIVETTQPCYDFAARDRFVWCATGVDGAPGVIRVDLGNEIETLRFAYANDLYVSDISGYKTTSCAFAGETNRLVFCTTAVNAGTITNKALTSNVATLTTSAAHGFEAGDSVVVAGLTTSALNGTYTIVSAPTTTTFTYTTSTSGTIASTADSGTADVAANGRAVTDFTSQGSTTSYNVPGNENYNADNATDFINASTEDPTS